MIILESYRQAVTKTYSCKCESQEAVGSLPELQKDLEWEASRKLQG